MTDFPGGRNSLHLNEQAMDWSKLERDVCMRIRALATLMQHLDASPEERSKIWADSVLPNVRLLVEFCVNVYFIDEQKLAQQDPRDN